MPKMAPLAFILLTAIAFLLFLENRALKRDREDMKAVYAKFLSVKVKGKALSDQIKPESLAVFKRGDKKVGCAIFN